MKKQLLLIFTILILPSLYGQKKLKFGVNFHTNLSSAFFINDGSVSHSDIESYKNEETSKPSYTVSINSEYKIRPTYFIGLSLGFQNTGYALKNRKIQFLDDNFKFIDADVKIKYVTHNLEIPIYIKKQFTKNIFATIGMSGTYNIENYAISKVKPENDKTERTKKYDKGELYPWRKINFSVNVGIGMNIFKKEKFTVFTQGYFQYGILGVKDPNPPLNRRIVSFGIMTGIRLN